MISFSRFAKELLISGGRCWMLDAGCWILDQKKVVEGQFVKKGQVIGTVGNTGNAKHTPSHLHFGIYKNAVGAVNPLPYVRNSPKLPVKASASKFPTAIAKNRN